MPQAKIRVVVFVRHGETTGESSIRYYGRTDLSLSVSGEQQMEAVRRCCDDTGLRFDLVITSTRRRCRQGASLIAPGIPSRALPGFDEVDFGAWEGLTAEEIARCDPGRYERWRQNPDEFVYPGGEGTAAFRARVSQTFEEVLPTLPARTLFVLHKGVIRTLLWHLLRDSQKVSTLRIGLGSIHVLANSDGLWRPLLLDGEPTEAALVFARHA